MKSRLFSKLSAMQSIAMGFFLIILTGALLLTLPIATAQDQSAGFLSALFTATSATCVTGLVIADTYTYWSVFGQMVILVLIQIGGLGFMTVGAFVAIRMKRNIGLKERGLLQESMNTLQIGGVVRLVKKIIFGTLILEGTGAVVLFFRFLPELGLADAVYYGIFHSVSAFCNAGFDLMGRFGEYVSLTRYFGDVTVNLTVMLLIVLGGIGFLVWDDITKKKLQVRKYLLHTKIVLITTAMLIFGGALLLWLFEKNNLMAGMTSGEAALTSLFGSVTARTAGFNTIDTAGMTVSSKLLTMVLMFIGGSPGSTAGGIKTTTFAVMLIFVWSTLRGHRGNNVGGRRLEETAIRKASIVFTINLFLAVGAAIAICALQPFDLSDVLFEVFSAIGTVGMSTGITRELSSVCRVIIIVLMYSGRIGSLTFVLALTERKNVAPVKQPEEKILIG